MQTCMIFKAKSHASLWLEQQGITLHSLSRLDILPAAKEPDLSSALVIFEFKALCCIIRLWKFTPMAEARFFKWLLEVSQQLNPALFMLPMWLSFTVHSLSNNPHTYRHTHADKWNLRESLLSLLNEETDYVNDWTPKVGVTYKNSADGFAVTQVLCLFLIAYQVECLTTTI